MGKRHSGLAYKKRMFLCGVALLIGALLKFWWQHEPAVFLKLKVQPTSIKNFSNSGKCIRKCANKEKLYPSNLSIGKCSFTEGKFSNTWNASSEEDFLSCQKAGLLLSQETKKFVSGLYHMDIKTTEWENGIVFSSKLLQFKLVYATINVIRELFDSDLPIEVFVAKEDLNSCHKKMQKLVQTTCRTPEFNEMFKRPRSRFGWKAVAILQSSIKNVLWLDTDCIPLVSPIKLLTNEKFRKFGAVFWPDLTGVQCKPEDVSIWPSGSAESALWHILDVDFHGDNWKHVQEMESGQMLIDTKRFFHALHLAYFLTEHGIFQQFAYGDKEAFRWSWLYLNLDYFFAEYPALVSYFNDFDHISKQCSRVHYLGGEPVFIHGKKRSRSNSNCGYHEQRSKILYTATIPRQNFEPIPYCYGVTSFHSFKRNYSFSENFAVPNSVQIVDDFWENNFFL